MTPVEKALKAAEQEFRSHQRHDLAVADYRRKYRLLCEAMAALESTERDYDASFSVFRREYQVKADAGEVEKRSGTTLRDMRKAGMLVVPAEIIDTVLPTKIVETARAVNRKTDPLPEAQAVGILMDSDDTKEETVDHFKQVLKLVTPLLPEDIPKPKKKRPELIRPEGAAEPQDPAPPTPLTEAVRESVIAAHKKIEEEEAELRALRPTHPAQGHIEKALKSVAKYAPTVEQWGHILRRLEVLRDMGIALQQEIVGDALTDEKLQEFLENES